MNRRGIGWAVKQMEAGKRVTRPGWNGKGMYLYLTSVTAGFEPCIVMYTAQGTHQPGWLASQPDLLATDWMLADGEEDEQPDVLTINYVTEGRVRELIQAHAGHRVGPMGPKGDKGDPGPGSGITEAAVRDIVGNYIEGCEIEVHWDGERHNVTVIHPRPERYAS